MERRRSSPRSVHWPVQHSKGNVMATTIGKRQGLGFIAALLLAALVAAPIHAGSEVGDKAPKMTPGGWFNMKAGTTWEDLEGKLILIEKWATW